MVSYTYGASQLYLLAVALGGKCIERSPHYPAYWRHQAGQHGRQGDGPSPRLWFSVGMDRRSGSVQGRVCDSTTPATHTVPRCLAL